MSTIQNPAILIAKTKAFVEEYMSGHDASHDFTHIQRVVALALKILRVEQESQKEIQYDPTIVILGAMMHDVGDRKYLAEGSTENPATIVTTTLVSLGAALDIAERVQVLVENVSHFHEIYNPARVKEVLQAIPELGIVQDADRLETLGAIGIGRTFTYGGVRGRDNGLQGNVDHFEDKLYGLTNKMKTTEGRRLSIVKTERIKMFEGWWNEEMSVVQEEKDILERGNC